MVEVAIVLVLLLALLFGIVDGGRLLWCYTMLSNAATEGVRYAAVRGTPSGHPATVPTIQAVVQSMAGLAPTPNVNVTCRDASGASVGCPGAPGQVVRVQAEYPFSFLLLTPVSGWSGPGGTLTLRSGSEMTIAR